MSGTWGDTVNNGITSLIETSLAGYTSIAMTDANYTLSQANGAADEARSMMINMTGTLTANRNVVCPNVNKMYVFRNSTTGGFSLVLKTSGGTGVTVPAGKTITVFCDGADNIFDATSYFSGAITVNGAFTTNSTITGGSTTTTGVFSAPLGSVGAPSYTFTGDTNTGAWSPAADTLAWSTGGAERMRIDSSGRIGIGVAPASTLDINGNVTLRGNITGASTAAAYTLGSDPGIANGGLIQLFGSTAGTPNIITAYTSGAERMRIDSSGNVGIGLTASAGYKLDVSGTLRSQTANGVAAQLELFQASQRQWRLEVPASSPDFRIYDISAAAERMRIDTSGNVGIGAAPATRLHAFGAAAIARIESSGDQYTQLQIKHATRQWAVVSGPSSDPYCYLEDTTGGRRVLQADFSGNVGINGAANGAVQLHINSAGGLNRAAIHVGDLATGISLWQSTGNDPAIIYGSTSALRFGTQTGIGAAGFVERMRIDSSGNVGIGASPSLGNKLEVTGGITATTGLNVTGNGGFYNAANKFGVDQNGSTTRFYASGPNTTTRGAFEWHGISSNGSVDTIEMTLDASGNVGIGVTPVYQFQVRGGTQAAAAPTDAGNKGGTLYLQDNVGGVGNGGTLLIGTTLGNATPFAAIKGYVTDGATNTVGDLVFSTRNAVADTALTERLRITGAGVIQDGAGLELGYKNIPRTTGGLTRGQAYATAAGFTVNTGSAAGSAYSVYNDSAAAFTITQGSGLTLRQGGTTNTGNRTLAARGFATIWFNSTTEAVISGSGLT